MHDGKLGIAIHGAGWVAHAHAASWKKNPSVQVVSVSDLDPQRAAALVADCDLACGTTDRYEEVLADQRVDVVDICSPSHVHARQAIAAAEAGKHVLVEKPMALTMEDNRALRDAVARARVKSLCSFPLRWNPEALTLKSLVDSGAIGRVFYIELDYWHGIGPGHHAWGLHSRRETGGSAMLLAGCHAVDGLRYYLGDEAVEVTAYANNQKQLFEYDANVVAIVKFQGGAVGKTSCLFDCEMPYTFNVDLAGTEGTLRDNRIWAKRLFPGQTGWASVPTVLMDSGDVSHHPFDAEINHFVQCITGDVESPCSIADGYRTHELCLAIDRSLEQGGRPVWLPLE